jgi:hypothetical protein
MQHERVLDTPDLLAVAAPELAALLLSRGERLVVVGSTRDGRPFRPGDWAERLAGVLAPYRAAGSGKTRPGSHLGYSRLVVPAERDGKKTVIVDPTLRSIEPLAWAFVLNFARDNGLETTTC